MELINERKKRKQETKPRETCINKTTLEQDGADQRQERKEREKKSKNKKTTIPIANTKEQEKDVERASRRKDKAFRAKALYATPNHFNRLKRGIAIIDSDLGLGDDINQSINPSHAFF